MTETKVTLEVKGVDVDFSPGKIYRLPGIGNKNAQDKRLLEDVSFKVQSGQLLSILGGSGSGKTTLLNTLASRIESTMKVRGTIEVDQSPLTAKRIRKLVGYVMQADHLLPNLTVRETLQFAALLRLPDSMSRKSKLTLVEDVIAELGLRECAGTYVGGEGRRGISGGEKRRVSIAAQILTNPSILLLDEPTSGLDSFTAHNLMETLLQLATKHNRIIICTIHQPRSDIFQLFDLVMLLSKGNLVYFGKKADAVPYFSRLGFNCPAHANPADFFLDVISVDYRSKKSEQTTLERMNRLVQVFKESPKDENMCVVIPEDDHNNNNNNNNNVIIEEENSIHQSETDYSDHEAENENNNDDDAEEEEEDVNSLENSSIIDPKELDIYSIPSVGGEIPLEEAPTVTQRDLYHGMEAGSKRASFLKATPLLTKRAYINLFRHSSATIRVVQAFSLAFMITICWLRLKSDQYGIQNRIGFLYQCLGLNFVGVLNSVALFPIERNVFYQERADGLYQTPAFFFSFNAVELPLNFIGALSFSALTYWVLGMNPDVGRFFLFVLVNFILLVTGESAGMIVCALFYDVGMATTFASVFMSIFNIIAGFFRPHDSLPWVLRIFNYILVSHWGAKRACC